MYSSGSEDEEEELFGNGGRPAADEASEDSDGPQPSAYDQSYGSLGGDLVDPRRGRDLAEAARREAESSAEKDADDFGFDDRDRDDLDDFFEGDDRPPALGPEPPPRSGDDDHEDPSKPAAPPAPSTRAPGHATYRRLKDGSHALEIRPGHRVKLDLTAPCRRARTRGTRGAATAAARARRPARRRGRARRRQGWRRRELVNDYTVTLGVFFEEPPPAGGLSLFQTALVHCEESRGGRRRARVSEGEALVNGAGGVGALGTFGDTAKARGAGPLAAGRRLRAAAAAGLWPRGGVKKGEVRTYVQATPLALVRHERVAANERFSLRSDGLYLFSSRSEAMMPGGILLRTARVDLKAFDDGAVRRHRARDKVFSAVAEDDAAKVDAMRGKLALAELFAKPRPAWDAPAILCAWLRAIKKKLTDADVGESLLLPLLVEGRELLLVVERPSERTFTVVVVATAPTRALRHHAVDAADGRKVKFRSALVLANVPKKNALDDVFWAAAYNLAVHAHDGDTRRFYDVLLPFLTGKTLEASSGRGRSPQRSETAYVRCLFDALHYLMLRRGCRSRDAKQVRLALKAQLADFVARDRGRRPTPNGAKVARLVATQLAYGAAKFAARPDAPAGFRDGGPRAAGHRQGILSEWRDALAWRVEPCAPDAGNAATLRKYAAIDALAVPEVAATFEEALEALRTCDRLSHADVRGADAAAACARASLAARPRGEAAQGQKEPEKAAPEAVPTDWAPGEAAEAAATAADCLWDGDCDYATQVEALLTLRRLVEHFTAAVLSTQQDRALDLACLVVPGAACAIADAILRRRAADAPSSFCCQLRGQLACGRQLGHRGYGLSCETFASQTAAIEAHAPALATSRDRPYRDLNFFWKFFLNADRAAFANYVPSDDAPAAPERRGPGGGGRRKRSSRDARSVSRCDRLGAQLTWGWSAEEGGYAVSMGGASLRCRPDPDALDPVTGRKIPEDDAPRHRYPSRADPGAYLGPGLSAKQRRNITENDILYRPSLPGFQDSKADDVPALGQRDAELLLSYLTVPYIRLPLVLTFFASEDRVHKLASRPLRGLLDAVLFEPGRHLGLAATAVAPETVPTPRNELLATPHGHLLAELRRAPAAVLGNVVALLRGARALDTGAVCAGHARAPGDEALVDRNSRLACDLHAHQLLLRRDATDGVVPGLLGSFLFLTTRHTFNKFRRDDGKILAARRSWRQRATATSVTGAFVDGDGDASTDAAWGRVAGARNRGRYTTTARGDAGGPVRSVADSSELDVEIDAQIGQLTLRGKHLAALESAVAGYRDVRVVFGDAAIRRRSEREHRNVYRLVGLDHSIEWWPTPHGDCPSIPDTYGREYDPSELFESELWIPSVFEPLRRAFFDGPRPAPMQFLLPDDPFPASAEVAELLGLHQRLGGPAKRVLGGGAATSPVIRRDAAHADNLSGGVETYTPPRLLRGLIPETLLDDFRFWRDESDPAAFGREVFRGYALDDGGDDDDDDAGSKEASDDLILVELSAEPRKRRDKAPRRSRARSRLAFGGAGVEWRSAAAAADEADKWLPCEVVRVDYGKRTYDLEFSGPYQYLGTQRGVKPEDVNARGANSEAKAEGEGQWRFAGLSDSEDDDWASDGHESDDAGDDGRGRARSLPFDVRARLGAVFDAAGRDGGACAGAVKALAAAGRTFDTVAALVDAVAAHCGAGAGGGRRRAAPLGPAARAAKSRLFTLAGTLARVECLSHVLAWTRATGGDDDGIAAGVPELSLVELPRLKLSFAARRDHAGALRLFSVDHVDLFVVPDQRAAAAFPLLEGIDHALLLSNARGDSFALVPVVIPRRPPVRTQPFSVELVLDREGTYNGAYDGKEPFPSTRFFLYAVHVSMAFLMPRGLPSALYLLLLRLLKRDYAGAFRLCDSVASDVALGVDEAAIFTALGEANDDRAPEAHAVRLKVSLVTAESGEALPWDLTTELSRYVAKLPHVGACCRLALRDELRLLESPKCAVDEDSAAYSPADRGHEPHMLALCHNRRSFLRALAAGEKTCAVATPPRERTSDGWPLYADETCFGMSYAEAADARSLAVARGVAHFPSFVLSRGEKKLAVVAASKSDEARTIPALVAAIERELTDDARPRCSAWRHHAASSRSDAPPADDGDDGGDVLWTWDLEAAGDGLRVEALGATAVLPSRDDLDDLDDARACWEWAKDDGKAEWRAKWAPFEPQTQTFLEIAFLSGKLYREQSGYRTSDYEDIRLRRKGYRAMVLGEEAYLSKRQEAIDRRNAEWRDQYEAYSAKRREARRGRDAVAVRGTAPLQRDSGVHAWRLRWTHAPGAGGRGDGCGVVAEGSEAFGPALYPCLGGPDCDGGSLGLHASGELWVAGTEAARVGAGGLLWSEGDEVACVLDTSDGGSLSFSVNGVPVDRVVEDVFETLGCTECYPAVSLAPLDDDGGGAAAKDAALGLAASKGAEKKEDEEHEENGGDDDDEDAADEIMSKEPWEQLQILELAQLTRVAPEKIVKLNAKQRAELERVARPPVATVSAALERAKRLGKLETSLHVGGESFTFKLAAGGGDGGGGDEPLQIPDGGGEASKLRRHFVGEGLRGQWELLSVKYTPPASLYGASVLGVIEKVWATSRPTSAARPGARAGSGSLGWGSGAATGAGGAAFASFPGKKAKQTNDSHRLALLLTQLYSDRRVKSVWGSLVNVLGRNKQLCVRLPRFRDSRRKRRSNIFNGWVDDAEPKSPLGELFEQVVPVMQKLRKRRGALLFPPKPPHDALPAPRRSRPSTRTDPGAGEARGLRPRVAGGPRRRRPRAPAHCDDGDGWRAWADRETRLAEARQYDKVLLVAYFRASWCAACRSSDAVVKALALSAPTARFATLDFDDCDDVAAAVGVVGTPCCVFFRGGGTKAHAKLDCTAAPLGDGDDRVFGQGPHGRADARRKLKLSTAFNKALETAGAQASEREQLRALRRPRAKRRRTRRGARRQRRSRRRPRRSRR
ncbi:hypothetical protein JL721_7202 [Aureococcus anophagefferens]|nr:hypothetical protein JL721_7202 [Aureococcus anophagefferens]